ncbi:hypothetical protein LCGC14_2081310 [marine sediment metagenome]|uniref:Uncharacterized protein n=1 Tax=marine sediment metagenome TaxID=412755 RepID=A0A0F9EFF8_9ZZZZ
MPDEMEGLKDVLKNLDKSGEDIIAGLKVGMTAATIATESHIKRAYNRPATGKGFANRSGKLRASIRQSVQVTRTAIIGFIHAGSGEVDYAAWVEFRWSGKYAYLWPGIIDMRKKIWDLLFKGAQGGLKK